MGARLGPGVGRSDLGMEGAAGVTCAFVPLIGLDPIRSGALRAKSSRKPSDAILEAGRWGWITADSISGSRMGQRVTEEAMAVAASGKRLHGAFAWSAWPRSDSPAESLPGCSF